MKLEAVDRRNPMLVRVATVADTEDYRVKVRGRKVKRWGKRGDDGVRGKGLIVNQIKG